MYERFTQGARKVIVFSQDEARRLGRNYIGTEHLLLGLLRETDGIAAQALDHLGVTLDKARERVEGIVGYGQEEAVILQPLTPRSKKVLELALREASRIGHTDIGTEHLLLGLLRLPQGGAAGVLSDLDVERDSVRRAVLRRMGGCRSPQGEGE